MYMSVVLGFVNLTSLIILLNHILFNECRLYVNIMRGKKYRQFRLLTWTLLIGQFVHPVEGEE